MMTLRDLPYLVIFIGVSAVIAAVVADITSDISDGMTANTTQTAAADNGTAGIAEVASWFDTIGLVGVAAIIIGLLVGAFMYFKFK